MNNDKQDIYIYKLLWGVVLFKILMRIKQMGG